MATTPAQKRKPAAEAKNENKKRQRAAQFEKGLRECAGASAAATTPPYDILTDIFLRLNVVSILRAKCVCKAWHAFANHPTFITSHLLHQTIPHNPPDTLLFHNKDKGFFFAANCADHPAAARRLVCPFLSSDHGVNVLGSCNGIFLIGAYRHSIGPWFPDKTTQFFFSSLYLWNPTTTECVKIPEIFAKVPKFRTDCRKLVYGLGYDSSTDDYKVIRMIYYYEKLIPYDYESDVHIYSLRSNSYKRIQDVPYSILPSHLPVSDGLFYDGAIHWLGETDRRRRNVCNRVIVTFDIANEEFRELQLPPLLYWSERVELGMLDNGLALYNKEKKEGSTLVYEMKKQESCCWVKTHTIQSPRLGPHCHSPLLCVPICILRNKKLLVQWRNYDLSQFERNFPEVEWRRKDLTLYRSNGGGGRWREHSEFKVDGLPEDFQVTAYFSTLVSLKQIKGAAS